METLVNVLPPTPERERAIIQQQKALAQMDRDPPKTIEDLRLVEGRAALAYFKAWQSIPIRWKGTGRRPIPEEWRRVGLRQSSVSGTNCSQVIKFAHVHNVTHCFCVFDASVRKYSLIMDLVSITLNPRSMVIKFAHRGA